jgi:hypothetical protein
MARINIEASAALSEWVNMAREDRGTYEKLVARALVHLPVPKLRPRATNSKFAILAMPDVADKVIAAVYSDRLARIRADAESYPSRIFANALVNVAWRNGPVEDIHAGKARDYPVDQRRLTPDEEHAVLAFAADRLGSGMDICRKLKEERAGRSRPEQVMPYGVAGMMLVTPSGWTLTEATRDVRLPKG